MATAARATRAANARTDLSEPSFQAFTLLRLGFVVAPVLFGLDKFTEFMADWSIYLWPRFASALPGTADQLMFVVGGIEIAAGILVAIRPRIGGLVVAAWLGGIIFNLLLLGDYHDIALRDFGLLLGAVALSRLAAAFPGVGFSGRVDR